jgi:hypothetical protein
VLAIHEDDAMVVVSLDDLDERADHGPGTEADPVLHGQGELVALDPVTADLDVYGHALVGLVELAIDPVLEPGERFAEGLAVLAFSIAVDQRW